MREADYIILACVSSLVLSFLLLIVEDTSIFFGRIIQERIMQKRICWGYLSFYIITELILTAALGTSFYLIWLFFTYSGTLMKAFAIAMVSICIWRILRGMLFVGWEAYLSLYMRTKSAPLYINDKRAWVREKAWDKLKGVE